MGCTSSEDIDDDLKHAPPDFELLTNPLVTQHHKIDFRCKYSPQDFATLFFQDIKFEQIVPEQKPKPETTKKELSDSSEPEFKPLKQLLYTPVKMPFSTFSTIMRSQYDFLTPQDVCATHNYINFKHGFQLRKMSEFSDVFITITEFVKFGYVFYRFKDVLELPAMAIFYWFDSGFNRFSSVKQLRNGLRNHFMFGNVETVKKYIEVVKSKSGWIGVVEFKKIIDGMKNDQKVDPIEQIYRKRELTDLDQSLLPITDSLGNFSDISTRGVKRQLEEVRQQAVDEKWSQQQLDQRIREVEAQDEIMHVGKIFE